MKMKYLAALLLMLFAVGCTQQTVSEDPATETGSSASSTEPVATSTVEPETETQLASTVTFNVEGMR